MNQKRMSDRHLGMDRPITRRDFINGVAVGTAAALSGSFAASDPLFAAPADSSLTVAAQDTPGYYPPLLTGMRGSHPGSFEDAHALRDGTLSQGAAGNVEEYDLIVVGAGISGLAAAHFYRAHTSASNRILILDNHDDFGGHAKRNEFKLNGRLNLMNGGTLLMDSPRPYGPVAEGLMRTLGVDVHKLAKATQHPKYYERRGLQSGIFFDEENFGSDKLVVGDGTLPIRQLLSLAPLSQRARGEIEQIEEASIDYLPGLSSDEKKQRLSRISYEAFLRDVVRVDPSVLIYYRARSMDEQGVGTDALSALDCRTLGLPGFQGMNLAKGSIPRMGFTPAGYEDTGGSTRLHFPDGNATIARLLVRDLIPAAMPGNGVENSITARVDYSELDKAHNPIRLRLSSTVIKARNIGDPATATHTEVTYRRSGGTFTARARGTVMACYNMMIPYLCPELPEDQKAALHSLIKTPLVYSSVALRNWQAFHTLKIHAVYAPGGYHTTFRLNDHVDIGAYKSSLSPEDPMLVHMVRTPCKPGLTEHEQNRAGRTELLNTSFETFEHNIRDQLTRTLKDGGFDAANDITAITVNRWPHGYAPEYNPLSDPDVPEAKRPHVLGRARFGRLTIANSDSGGGAYTDVAIDQGYRAVMELVSTEAAKA